MSERGEALVTVNLKRLNRCNQQKVLISHFPKPKDGGYFLIIGNPSKNDLLVMKRVSFNRFTTKNLNIVLPENFRTEKLELHLMCDSYIGLDQYHYIDLLNINAYLESQGSTAPAAKPQAASQRVSATLKGYKSYRNIQEEVLQDIGDDEALLPTERTRALIDDTEDVDAQEFEKVNEEAGDDEEDYENMIEKELDNWFN